MDTIINCEYFFPGLTALRSDEVIDLMIKEYPGKHAEYSVILQEMERQRITEEYSVSTLFREYHYVSTLFRVPLILVLKVVCSATLTY